MRYLILFLATMVLLSSCQKKRETQIPGQYKNFTLLPNGWRLTPVGRHARLGELPLNMVVTKDDKFAITVNSGTGPHSLSLVNLDSMKEVQRIPIPKTWRGLALSSDEKTVFASGANDDCLRIFSFNGDSLSYQDSIALKPKGSKTWISVTGLAYWPKTGEVFVVSKKSNRLYRVNPAWKKVTGILPMDGECFDVLIHPKKPIAYVSVWGKQEIAVVDLKTFKASQRIKVEPHPCDMALTKNGKYLYVANANVNSVSVINTEQGREVEVLNTALKAKMPYGSTPNSVALSPDEKELFVANADNNYVAVFDVSHPGKAHSLGFIPVGWYPTVVRTLHHKNVLLVVDGKGLASMANPLGPKPGVADAKKINKGKDEYIGRLFKGALSYIPIPDAKTLAIWTKQVYRNTPFTRKQKIATARQSVVPSEHNGKRSPIIKHIFYVIRENRTYDQVFGDIHEGNGDSTLCLFPDSITPNAHRLAHEFVLFDNFYTDAEVSADGHNWSTAAYATDYTEKTWPTYYGGKGGTYDYEGGPEIASPTSGYIWDNVLTHGLTFRSYGEFAWHDKKHPGKYKSNLKRLIPYTPTDYPCFDLSIPDTFRVARFKHDFDSLLAANAVPNLSIIRLPNDHTAGTMKGMPTVTAMIGENDYALGQLVDFISHSKIWPNSVMFILEDDAQDGSDHVDAHRSVLLAVGPNIKRHYVDHTMYSTSSVIKTMELILGLKPMTQYDLSATPLLADFTDKADLTPYNGVRPNVDFHAMNTPDMYGAKRCEEFNLKVEDAIPDLEFSEIIWKAVKGADSPMPAPVHSAFVHVTDLDD